MTSFDPIHPKTGAIIELLAEEKTLSAKELLKRLVKQGHKLSTANFYKILNKMVENQILVKNGENVSLNKVWATYILKYANLMQEEATDIAPFPTLKDGDRKVYSAESLDKIDPIWTHLVLDLFTQEEDKTIYVYHSHPWYILGRPATERRMYDSCYTEGKKIQIYYGNTTPLDQYGFDLHKTSPCKPFISNKPPFPKTGYGLWLCGDYIIECLFPPLIDQYFESFFERVNDIKDFDLKTFSSIFHIKVPTELIVSRDKQKAATLRQSFLQFGRS